jgi:hypothetical protein
MTAAQKAAKANFKKAIAYRQKTGVSLKEAFAHVYGKKVGAAPKKKAAKKAAPKKVAKKQTTLLDFRIDKKTNTKKGKVKAHTRRVAGTKIGLSIAKKAAAKVKSLARKAQDAYYEGFYEGKPAALAKKRAELKAKRVSAAKKKVSEKQVLNKIHRVKNEVNQLDELQHKHMISGMHKHKLDIIKKLNDAIETKKDNDFNIILNTESLKTSIKNKSGKSSIDIQRAIISDQKKYKKEIDTHIKELKKLL